MREKPQDPKRSEVAKAITRARTQERIGSPYKINRAGWEYAHQLAGLEHLFSYVRNLPSKTVLDIGSGTTEGVHDISQNAIAEGLHFEATVLRPRSEIAENLGLKDTHITSGEVLRGIPDASIGCIIALHSLRYSAAPELAAKSIHRVLVPGGVLKAAKLEHAFSKIYDTLETLGYDINVYEIWGGTSVLLAIKPGNISGMTAAQLLQLDKEDGQAWMRF
jgi:ubiquinone/menaquinone biosynthesis C-methylase UbiE